MDQDRATALIKRYRNSISDSAPTATGFVDFLIDDVRPIVQPHTWRVYRAAVGDYLETLGEGAAATRLREMKAARVSLPARTAALKMRQVPRTEFFQLCAYLLKFSRSNMAPALRHWLVAGVATGLRPCEWETARLSGNVLFVENAKSSETRSNGPTRTLDLTALSDGYRIGIVCHIRNVETWNRVSQFELHSDKATSLLASVRSRYPALTGLSLYSLRHQFASNSKALHDRLETAALLGHAVTSSASAYGRKGWAWQQEVVSADFPAPFEPEVTTVRDDIADRIAKMHSRKAAGVCALS